MKYLKYIKSSLKVTGHKAVGRSWLGSTPGLPPGGAATAPWPGSGAAPWPGRVRCALGWCSNTVLNISRLATWIAFWRGQVDPGSLEDGSIATMVLPAHTGVPVGAEVLDQIAPCNLGPAPPQPTTHLLIPIFPSYPPPYQNKEKLIPKIED